MLRLKGPLLCLIISTAVSSTSSWTQFKTPSCSHFSTGWQRQQHTKTCLLPPVASKEIMPPLLRNAPGHNNSHLYDLKQEQDTIFQLTYQKKIKFQNAVALFTLSATSTSSHLLSLLHRLSIEYQVKCKVPILIFMAIHGSGSRYLKSALLITLVTSLNNCCQFQGSPEQD